MIEGAVAIVTGGAKGLGLAIATHLSSVGGSVVVVDRDETALAALPSNFGRYVLDVTNIDAAKKVTKQIVEKYGRLNLLVNNAGVIFNEPFVNIMNSPNIMHDYARFRESIRLNLDSVFVMTTSVVEQMVLSRTRGSIVNISSISACGNEGQTAYSAAKAGVNAMTVTWSKELGKFGIRVNAVAPGFIATDSTHAVLRESQIKHIKTNTPLGRLGLDTEVAKAVASLVENDFLNGVILDVNGGLRI